jgi:hypothetical protein
MSRRGLAVVARPRAAAMPVGAGAGAARRSVAGLGSGGKRGGSRWRGVGRGPGLAHLMCLGDLLALDDGG